MYQKDIFKGNMLILSVTRPWNSTSRMWGGLPPPGCLHAFQVPAASVMGTEPAVLDNFTKSLFGPTVAVTVLKQEVSRGDKRCAKTQHGFSWTGPVFLPSSTQPQLILAKFFRQSHHKIPQFGKKFLFLAFCC